MWEAALRHPGWKGWRLHPSRPLIAAAFGRAGASRKRMLVYRIARGNNSEGEKTDGKPPESGFGTAPRRRGGGASAHAMGPNRHARGRRTAHCARGGRGAALWGGGGGAPPGGVQVGRGTECGAARHQGRGQGRRRGRPRPASARAAAAARLVRGWAAPRAPPCCDQAALAAPQQWAGGRAGGRAAGRCTGGIGGPGRAVTGWGPHGGTVCACVCVCVCVCWGLKSKAAWATQGSRWRPC
jgi:hypothetical protein